jgi:hypothetical protein
MELEASGILILQGGGVRCREDDDRKYRFVNRK